MSVGRHTYGASNIDVHSWDQSTKIQIGAFCSIADQIHVYLGGNHRHDWISTFPFSSSPMTEDMVGPREGHPQSGGDITIGNDVWIGSHVSIMSGVKIGNGACIAAFSHVVKDVDDYELVGGNPARHIKYRFDSDTRRRLLELRWWELQDHEIMELSNHLCATPNLGNLDALEAIVTRRNELRST